MVKENGMVMIPEEEYCKIIEENKAFFKELNIAKMELSIYRKSMFDLAIRNLNEDNKFEYGNFGTEVTPDDFADIASQIALDASNGKIEGIGTDDACDLWVIWNGMCCRIVFDFEGEASSYIMPAIKEAYNAYLQLYREGNYGKN